MKQFLAAIENKSVKVAVVGLGYVGLPLCVEFARSGFRVLGIDLDGEKVRRVNRGESYIGDVESKDLRAVVRSGAFKAFDSYAAIRQANVIIICVPTPLRKTRDPDLSYIVSAVDRVAEHMASRTLIVLESTTYPGTCDEIVRPKIESTGRRIGRDFWLAFSPERVDPGNPKFVTHNIPKVIGGTTPQCTKIACAIYSRVIAKVFPVSSTRVAEMVKLLENTFRSVNIGLVNEIAMMCHLMGVDVWEVIEGAASKPFGFMPFYPGPGLGGHCIPIDPLYLSWKAKAYNFDARFIELASQINSFMPFHVISLVQDALNRGQKCIRGSRVLVLGVAYKKDVADIRESPSLEVMKHLASRGARLFFNDPQIRDVSHEGITATRCAALTPALLRRMDCVLILTDHTSYDYDLIGQHSRLIIDTRNAMKKAHAKNRSRVTKL